MSTNYENLIFEEKDGIGFIKMNRPKALNALSKELLTELEQVVEYVEKTPSIKGVIITGE